MERLRARSCLAVALAASVPALAAAADGPDPGTSPGTADRAAEEAIGSALREWLSPAGAAPENLAAWLAELRSSLVDVELALDSLRITAAEGGLRRVSFGLERTGRAADGSLHVARWHQVWWVRVPERGAPHVVRIEQRTALPYPGTGPRIVCD